jgi:hypothetical protein
MGVIAELKELFDQGKSPKELLGNGYKKATVYAAYKRWLGEKGGKEKAEEYLDKSFRRKVFEQLEKGESLVKIAIELEMETREVKAVYREWKELKEIDLNPQSFPLKRLDALEKEVKGIKTQIESTGVELASLSKTGEGIKGEIAKLNESLKMIEHSVGRRFKDDNKCVYLEADGICSLWYWPSKIEGWEMKSYREEGKVVWKLNAAKHPLVCASCPSYKPRGE